MNRYIGSALLPLLTRCAALFGNTEHYAHLVDSTLETIYRLSKGRSLTKAQRDAIEECLLAICKYALTWFGPKTRERNRFTGLLAEDSCMMVY